MIVFKMLLMLHHFVLFSPTNEYCDIYNVWVFSLCTWITHPIGQKVLNGGTIFILAFSSEQWFKKEKKKERTTTTKNISISPKLQCFHTIFFLSVIIQKWKRKHWKSRGRKIRRNLNRTVADRGLLWALYSCHMCFRVTQCEVCEQPLEPRMETMQLS